MGVENIFNPSIQSKFSAVATLLYGKEHIQIISNHGIIKSEKSKQNKNTELNILWLYTTTISHLYPRPIILSIKDHSKMTSNHSTMNVETNDNRVNYFI